MRPVTEAELADLFRKMRIYRFFYWICVASAVLYLFSVLGLRGQDPPPRFPLADMALAYGAVCALAIPLGKWLAFRPRTLRSRGLSDMKAMSSYTFLTLAFLLVAAESLGMAAVTAASLGARPVWKLAMLCLWQLALSVILTPDRGQWDRLLTRWETTFATGEENEAR